MLGIPLLRNEVLDDYYNIISEAVLNALSVGSTDNTLKAFFTNEVIKDLLIGEHQLLIDHHNRFSVDIITQENFTRTYRSINKKNKIQIDNENINNYGNTVKAIKRIFNYEKIISEEKEVSYKIASLLDRNTCTYCNRQYTLTVSEDKDHIIRPQFDHWYPKSQYPILALAIYNLLPSCSICNSGIKGRTPFSIENHVHPYLDPDIAKHYTFSYGKTDVYKNRVIIETSNTRVRESIKAFRLEEVYRAHSDYELKDLLDLASKYPENYINKLISNFDGLHLTKEEVYRMIFGIEVNEVDFYKRPFSKFKHDIIDELLKLR